MKRTLPLPASRSLYVLLIALLFTMAACDAGAPISEQAPDEAATKAPAPGSLVIEVEPTFADSTTDSTDAARPGAPLRHRRAILQQAAREHPSLKPHIEIEATPARTNGAASRASRVSSRTAHSRPPARSMNAEETEGLKERGQVVLAQTSYEGAEANLTGTIVQNGNAVAAGSLSTSVPPEGTLLYTGDVDRGDTMELELAGSYEGDPVVAATVPLSSWVLGYSFGEWATGVTTTLYRVLPDGSTEQIAQTTFAFYHIPDVEELEVTPTPPGLEPGDVSAVQIVGIGSDGERSRLPDVTAIDVTADGIAGVGGLYWAEDDTPYSSVQGVPLAEVQAGYLSLESTKVPSAAPAQRPSADAKPPNTKASNATQATLEASLNAKPEISGSGSAWFGDLLWDRVPKSDVAATFEQQCGYTSAQPDAFEANARLAMNHTEGEEIDNDGTGIDLDGVDYWVLSSEDGWDNERVGEIMEAKYKESSIASFSQSSAHIDILERAYDGGDTWLFAPIYTIVSLSKDRLDNLDYNDDIIPYAEERGINVFHLILQKFVIDGEYYLRGERVSQETVATINGTQIKWPDALNWKTAGDFKFPFECTTE